MPPRSLQENFFKETDSRRSPCRRRTGPFLHPVFIYLLFFFFFLFLSSPYPTHPTPRRILYRLTLTVVRVASFMATEKSSGSFFCASLHPLCLSSFPHLPTDIHPQLFIEKRQNASRCVCVCQIWRFISTIGTCLACSLCFSLTVTLSLSLSPLSLPPLLIEGPQLLL